MLSGEKNRSLFPSSMQITIMGFKELLNLLETSSWRYISRENLAKDLSRKKDNVRDSHLRTEHSFAYSELKMTLLCQPNVEMLSWSSLRQPIATNHEGEAVIPYGETTHG